MGRGCKESLGINSKARKMYEIETKHPIENMEIKRKKTKGKTLEGKRIS